MLQLRTQYLPGLRQTLIYRKTIDHSSNCGNISRYICLICFGQKKNTVEAYFTNSSLQSRDSFPGIQGKLDLITPKSNTVSEFNVIDRHTSMRTVDIDQQPHSCCTHYFLHCVPQ